MTLHRNYSSRVIREGSPTCKHKGRKIKARGLCGSCYNNQITTGALEKIQSGVCPMCEKESRAISKSGNMASYCQTCLRRSDRKWKSDNPERWAQHQWKAKLKHKFGITPDIYQKMWDTQQGKCAICYCELLKPLSTKGCEANKACLDHNHTTNKVRAILCSLCNAAIGKMKDSPSILRSAADYLEKHE